MGKRRDKPPPHPFEISGSRRRAPSEATPTLLRYLNSYLREAGNRKKATASLLFCSERTASRLLSSKTPYRGGMRLEWVYRICQVVGKPPSSILRDRRSKGVEEAVVGWEDAVHFTEAMQLATDCALAIVYMAFHGYGLRGNYSVDFNSGMPTHLCVSLSMDPDAGTQVTSKKVDDRLQKLIVSKEKDQSGKWRMYIKHWNPDCGMMIDKDFLTYTRVNKHLKEIYALTAHHATNLARETANAQTA